jgi:hypothetical protein
MSSFMSELDKAMDSQLIYINDYGKYFRFTIGPNDTPNVKFGKN